MRDFLVTLIISEALFIGLCLAYQKSSRVRTWRRKIRLGPPFSWLLTWYYRRKRR